jgi:hypothetical protein
MAENCPYCGYLVSEGDEECPNCYAHLRVEPTKKESEKSKSLFDLGSILAGVDVRLKVGGVGCALFLIYLSFNLANSILIASALRGTFVLHGWLEIGIFHFLTSPISTSIVSIIGFVGFAMVCIGAKYQTSFPLVAGISGLLTLVIQLIYLIILPTGYSLAELQQMPQRLFLLTVLGELYYILGLIFLILLAVTFFLKGKEMNMRILPVATGALLIIGGIGARIEEIGGAVLFPAMALLMIIFFKLGKQR